MHGLLYVFLIPPWQHHDEPGHFEYAWLIANRPGLPQQGDYDREMRQILALSLAENNFFDKLDFQPDYGDAERPAWIGISQVGDPPLYYWLVSLPLRLLPETEFTTQLYAGRLVSLLLYLLSLAAAWLFAYEITVDDTLAALLPLSLALLPGFADIMTALNNDALAIAAASWVLWAAVRLLRRGFKLHTALLLAALTPIVLASKTTAYISLLAAALALLFSLAPRRWHRLAWAGIAAATAGLLFAGASLNAPAAWTQSFPGASELRQATSLAIHGDFALTSPIPRVDGRIARLYQLMPAQVFNTLQEQPLTLGFWTWSDRPAIAVIQFFGTGSWRLTRRFESSPEPRYYSFQFNIPAAAYHTWIGFSGNELGAQPGAQQIYFDGLALVAGELLEQPAPDILDKLGLQVQWGNNTYQNLLRNPSGEQNRLGLQPWLANIDRQYLFGSLAGSLYAASDLESTFWYLRATAGHIFRTFWARFGWGNIPLAGAKPYRLLGIFTAAAVLGALLAAWQARRRLDWTLLLLLALSAGGVWFQTLARGTYTLFSEDTFYPVARYGYTAILPTLFALVAGWQALGAPLARRLNLPAAAVGISLVGLILLLALWSLYSIWLAWYAF